jgi:sec-independent protein translocase protein TatA
MFDFIRNIGAPELIIILIVIVVLFGGKKLRELARGLGESTKEAKKLKEEVRKTIKKEDDEDEEGE